MRSLSRRTTSYANAVLDRPVQTQELASDKATQTSDVVRDTTSRQAKIRNTPYEIGHELVTPVKLSNSKSRHRVLGQTVRRQVAKAPINDQTTSTSGSTNIVEAIDVRAELGGIVGDAPRPLVLTACKRVS